MQQLIAAAAETTGPAAGETSTSPDKDSSTITIFNENSEVKSSLYLQFFTPNIEMSLKLTFILILMKFL